MKKRAMKKWIPKNTLYCYEVLGVTEDGKLKTKTCKWHRINPSKDEQECGFCLYLNKSDWGEDGTMLLWDGYKECGIKEDIKF